MAIWEVPAPVPIVGALDGIGLRGRHAWVLHHESSPRRLKLKLAIMWQQTGKCGTVFSIHSVGRPRDRLAMRDARAPETPRPEESAILPSQPAQPIHCEPPTAMPRISPTVFDRRFQFAVSVSSRARPLRVRR